MSKLFKLPVSILRGGTSRGAYILEKDLPADKTLWDSILLRLMGSPDKKQIDGLGGAQSVTSKVAIIKKSERPDADVDYTFAQVSIDKPIVSYKGNCGNISSGVGPFAIEKGLVEPKEDITTVRIYNTNTDKIIAADVKTDPSGVIYDGDFSIAGVPGTASPVKLKFVDPAGSFGKGLLPTGNATDILTMPDGREIECSIVDAANPLVFIRAESLGMRGTELPEDITPELEKKLETVRGLAAVKLGFTDDYRKAAWDTPGVPKMTFVTDVTSYTASNGREISADSIDIVSRMMSMQHPHQSYAMTGAMCTAAAAVIPGSIVNSTIRKDFDPQFIRIGHPSGILECGVDFTENGAIPEITDTFGFRTANLLMDGTAYIRL